MNMKAFMKEDMKNRGTMTFPGIEAFKDENGKPIDFIIKRLSMKKIREIRNLYKSNTVYRDKKNGDRPIIGANGQVAVMKDYDAESAGLHIMVDAFVQPKLDDPELMKYYEVVNRLDMPQVLFNNKMDYEYADRCVMEACGLAEPKKDKEVIEELKN